MTVYKKLQTARHKLAASGIKQSGKNTFHGWTYWQLEDFIPSIHRIFDEVGLCGVVTFGDTATLTIYDSDGGESTVFSIPIVSAESNKGQSIQVLGSTVSYLRRYLWLLAMEISEDDTIDNQEQEVKKELIKIDPKKKPPALIAGKDLPWRIKITTDPDTDMVAWIKIVLESAHISLSQAKSLKDVMDIFTVNRQIFKRLESDAPDDYAVLLADFTASKEKFPATKE